MTPQKIFNTVINHLYTQKKKSFSFSNNVCQYKTSEGLKCAIGCLIPDEIYIKEMDEDSWIIKKFSRRFESLSYFTEGNNTDLLDRLQKIHDEASTSDDRVTFLLKDLAAELNKVAKEFNLVLPEIAVKYI